MALGALMSLAWAIVSRNWHCQKSIESGNLSLNKAVIRWMSV